jgi:hypothetical protein
MISRVVVAIAVVAAFCALACDDPNTKKHGDTSIQVTNMFRAQQWEQVTANAQHEFVVFDLSVDVHGLVEIKKLSLVAKDGTSGASPLMELSFGGKGKQTAQVGFLVPKGSEPKTLTLGSAVFDIPRVKLAKAE